MNRKKIFLSIIAIILIIVCSQIVTLGCSVKENLSIVSIEKTSSVGLVDTYTILYSDGTTYQFTITNGKNGEDGQDADKVTIQEIYQSYVEKYGEISYSDFLLDYLQLSTDNSLVINECLLSSMKVYTEFNVTSSSGWGPYQNTSKAVSVQCGSAVVYKMFEDVTYIVTNYHVVFNKNANSDNGGQIAKKIVGYLYGSEGNPADTGTKENGYTIYDYGQYGIELTYCGGSIEYDLAVLKVETSKILAINEDVKAVKLANEYYVGEAAIAVGNPENEGISASQGIVSIDNEYIQLQIDSTARYYRSIRIDTAIYGGSSGGGLFNKNGKLIGITNAGDTEDQNINYAIPIQIVKSVVNNILHYYNGTDIANAHKISLGVTLDSSNSKYVFDENTGYGKIKENVMIKSVVENSIAQSLGLQEDDIIKSIFVNETEYVIDRYFEIGDILFLVKETDTLHIKYVRDNQVVETDHYTVLATDLNIIDWVLKI